MLSMVFVVNQMDWSRNHLSIKWGFFTLFDYVVRNEIFFDSLRRYTTQIFILTPT